MMPKFSVVIPVHNVAPYIGACLDSVLGQAVADWECVCVDDGSADGSGDILDDFARRDIRIRVYHQRNAGVSAARNRALERIVGEWLLFLDSDDIWHPKLLKFVDQETEGRDMVCFKKWRGQEADAFVGTAVTCPKVRRESWKVKLPSWPFALGFCQYACRREALDASCRFDVRFAYGEDRLWHVRVLACCDRIATIDAVLYGYRVRPNSATDKAISGLRVRAGFGYAREMLRLLASIRKRVPSQVVHELLVIATERTVARIHGLNQDEQAELWREWFRGLRSVPLLKGSGVWFRCVVSILRCLPFRWLALLLCYIPQWLKQKGLHR